MGWECGEGATGWAGEGRGKDACWTSCVILKQLPEGATSLQL
jgi:hypothetical protein